MISSIWTQEWSVYISWSPKCVPRFVLWRCRPGGKQTKGTWAIRTPPAEDPLRQAAQWPQAERQPSKNIYLNTQKALNLSYFHNFWRLLMSRSSQHILPGNIWRGPFVWNEYQKSFICVCYRKLKKMSRCHFQMAPLQNLSFFVNLGLKRVSNNFNELEV